MIRPAPPAPFKTAFITFLIAVVVGLLVAGGAKAGDANWKLLDGSGRPAASPSSATLLIYDHTTRQPQRNPYTEVC